MYVFIINDKSKKTFNYMGVIYRTPCRVIVENHKEIDQLNHILKQNNITNITIRNKIKNIHSRQITKPTGSQGIPISLTINGGSISTRPVTQRSTSRTSAVTIIKF
jgi:hypothetical protein